MVLQFELKIERGTLTLEEAEALFRQGLKDELPLATAHVTAPIGDTRSHPSLHKVMAAALRIVSRVPHDCAIIDREIIETEVDETWTDAELNLLRTNLQFHVTPMKVSRTDAKEALEGMGVRPSDALIREARSHILQGRAEAHDRSALLDHPDVRGRGGRVLALLDDMLVAAIRSSETTRPLAQARGGEPLTPAMPFDGNAQIYARPSSLRFSEIIDETLKAIVQQRNWKPDNGQRLAILEHFAWLTGDKPLCEYNEGDVGIYVAQLRRIPNDFRWGKLHEDGPMATGFAADDLPAVTPENQRSDRTINRDLSVMHAVSEQLAKTHWRLKYGKDLEMNFRAAAVTIKENPETPTRMPWTPAHLKVMYGLPLWQGSGGSIARLKTAPEAKIYQDAAYWVPLIGTYTGLAREEACGLEAADFNFDAAVPYLLVRNNMTRSKDGINPAGLKREARYRVMPLHPELLRLGLRDYVEAIVAEHGDIDEKPMPIFPELYSEDAKHRSVGKKAPEIGGRRFYKRAWLFIVDATHAILPLPETVNGKKADYHSQRTYNQSVLASPKVSQTILDRHMGHASKGTGPRSYNRRALAVGEEKELKERLEVLIEQMPVVSSEVPRAAAVKLLPLKQRSRVGSAEGRNAQQNFCA